MKKLDKWRLKGEFEQSVYKKLETAWTQLFETRNREKFKKFHLENFNKADSKTR